MFTKCFFATHGYGTGTGYRYMVHGTYVYKFLFLVSTIFTDYT